MQVSPTILWPGPQCHHSHLTDERAENPRRPAPCSEWLSWRMVGPDLNLVFQTDTKSNVTMAAFSCINTLQALNSLLNKYRI